MAEKLYEWTKLAKTQIECRIYCPKCNASKVIHGDDNPKFWEIESRHPWVVAQCDKCQNFIMLKKRINGVTVQI